MVDGINLSVDVQSLQDKKRKLWCLHVLIRGFFLDACDGQHGCEII